MWSIVISESDYKPYGREILLHEKAHVLSLHSMDILFLTLVETVQWWNPIAYLLGRSLLDVHEHEADDYVLHQGISLHNYQALLVKKALANTSYAFAKFSYSSVNPPPLPPCVWFIASSKSFILFSKSSIRRSEPPLVLLYLNKSGN